MIKYIICILLFLVNATYALNSNGGGSDKIKTVGGATKLYKMNQDVQITDNVEHAKILVTSATITVGLVLPKGTTLPRNLVAGSIFVDTANKYTVYIATETTKNNSSWIKIGAQ